MSEEAMAGQQKFDHVLGLIDGLPGGSKTRPTTVIATMPLIGNAQTFVIQTFKDAERGFVIFLQMVDSEGRARFVIPNKVALALYRQHDALADRSTPASRARKRKRAERARAKKQREARKSARAAS